MSETKTCTKCNETKALEAFPKRERGKHGVDSRCKGCRLERQREWRAEKRDLVNEYARQRRNRDPEAVKAINRRSYANNADKRRAESRAYRAANADRVRARNAEYEAARPELRERKKEEIAARQADSLQHASNWGKEWTGPELELAADMSRTVGDVAKALGRTYAAVVAARHLLHTDPRKARMAGTDVKSSRARTRKEETS